MTHTAAEKATIETANEYSRRVDAGSADLIDLCTDDVEIYFPKFGVAIGKPALRELATVLFTRLRQLSHDHDSLLCIVDGDHVVVEGTSRGTTHDGLSWAAGHNV